MEVLALASYPVEAAATRYRLTQFVGPLAARGINLTIHPFLDSRLFASLYRRTAALQNCGGLVRATLQRLGDISRARKYDLLLVQREAMMFGPPLVEWLAMRSGRLPLVLDLDDATYVRYVSPTYGRWASALKWFGKTDDLIRWASVVICGNRAIADYAAGKGARTVIIPTVVDTDRFCPRPEGQTNELPVLGWIGTHSTFPYLESIFPALAGLARRHRFRVRIIGAGRERVSIPGVEVENLGWKMEREIADLQSFDVGLYPLVEDEWSVGKSGFKAIQYLAVGLPYVATPVGASAEIGEAGVTHFAAASPEEWSAALAQLLADGSLRAGMGAAGRRHSLAHYTVPEQAEKLARALREAASLKG